VPAGASILVPVVLDMLQPDLGTNLAIPFGVGEVTFLAGCPLGGSPQRVPVRAANPSILKFSRYMGG
jgi:hypothetical protein